MAGLVWFFFLLLAFALFLAGGQKTHRIDFPLFVTIFTLGSIIAVAAIRRLIGWLLRRGGRDVDA
jgi:hypothetical protein